ncbi:hypothetical protein [Serratia marcescens]|uniref:hypothetical protein n=1 Tax=Serratia marcescens TaxID=615 RepID=UPI003F86B517
MKIVRKSMLALLLAASVPMTGQAAGIVSTVATASDDIVVSSNAEATVTATGRTDLISGSYPVDFIVGSWSASVTAGALAFRFNRGASPVDSAAKLPSAALSVNSTDATKKLRVFISSGGVNNSNTTQVGDETTGWRVMPQGTSNISGGTIRLNAAQTLTPGSYPIGIDVAAYAY